MTPPPEPFLAGPSATALPAPPPLRGRRAPSPPRLLPSPPPAGTGPCGAGAAGWTAPILDHRDRIAGPRRWLPSLLTLAVWGAGCALFAPVLLAPGILKGMAGLGVGGGLARPLRRLSLRRRADRADGGPAVAAPQPLQPELSRQSLAARFGLQESELFRARHARICTVHHDAEGIIVSITLDAHPAR